MENNKPNTAIAVRTKMQESLATIETKLKAIKEVTDSGYKTNCEFRFNPAYTANAPINIATSTNLSLLINCLGYIKGQADKYREAAEKVLHLQQYPVFIWMNYSYEAWEHDFKVRIAILSQHETVNKLKKAKEKLEQFMTEEDRLALTLKEIEELL